MTYSSYLALDFGTTNTVAAVVTGDSPPQRVKFGNDWRLPSAVFWAETGPIVGTHAERSRRLDPTRFCRCPKREMGYSSVALGGGQVPVVQVVASVLSAVKRETELQFGRPPSGTILTWPVQWASSRRSVMRHAAQISGFTDVDYLEEPAAAAIRIGTLGQMPNSSPFAVLDFGGGTLDVAVLVRTGSTFEVLASDGADPLGGEDIDDLVFAHAVSRLADRDAAERLTNSSDPSWDIWRGMLRTNCQLAKEQLSEMEWGSIGVPHNGDEIRLTRSQFASLVEDVLQRAVGKLAEAIDQSDCKASRLPVYMVGGSTRIPLLSEIVHQRLGCEVRLLGDPQFVVSEGAAIWLAKQHAGRGFQVLWSQRNDVARDLSQHTANALKMARTQASEVTRAVQHHAGSISERVKETAQSLQENVKTNSDSVANRYNVQQILGVILVVFILILLVYVAL